MIRALFLLVVFAAAGAFGIRLWSFVLPALPYAAGSGVVLMGLSLWRGRAQLRLRRIQIAQQRERERISKASTPPAAGTPPAGKGGNKDDSKDDSKDESDDIVLHPVVAPRKGAVDEASVEASLSKLRSLIGLGAVKEQIDDLVKLAIIQQERRSRGLDTDATLSFHMVFTGNPGTGKTTVARLVGDILRELGFLAKGHVVEVDRGNLVGRYIGHTAVQTKKKIQEAMGGVLFIDEAYTLSKGGERDFGQEAIDTLLKAMEDFREGFVVIVAGYGNEMKTFIESNPGLESRFNTYIHFEDYSPDELTAIFANTAAQQNYMLARGVDKKLKDTFERLIAEADGKFANGREARRLWEKTVQNQARRLHGMSRRGDSALVTIIDEDIPDSVKGGKR